MILQERNYQQFWVFPFNLWLRAWVKCFFPCEIHVDPSVRCPYPSIHSSIHPQNKIMASVSCLSPWWLVCRSSIYWFWSIGRSIFRSILLPCSGFKVKIKLWHINIPWKYISDSVFVKQQACIVKSLVLPVVHWIWVMMNRVLTPRGELSIHYRDHLLAIISRPH